MSRAPLGIYIHIPFCNGKCPYCDFYSVQPSGDILDEYRDAVLREIDSLPASGAKVDTVYFGGGTPLLLGADRLCSILRAVEDKFSVLSGSEITVEVNPRSTTFTDLLILKRAGFSRLSIGAQSGVDSELAALDRRHTAEDIVDIYRNARAVGFENISLDLMLAIPGQTMDSLKKTIELYTRLGPEHISAYILKIEPNTPFGRNRDKLALPDDDAQADIYLRACALLEDAGYHQYEISNFSREGRESRHNLKYWNDEEYFGIGAAAHGFFNDKRYYHERSISGYIAGEPPVDDGSGGSRDEYAMLRLRLADGLTFDGWRSRFGEELPEVILKRARPLSSAGLLILDDKGIRLTRDGFLVSNSIIAQLIL